MNMNIKIKKTINAILLNFISILLIVYVVGPLLWVAVASFQGENELLRKPPRIIPQNPTLANYKYVFTGEIPTDYEVKGQLRSRISQEARLIPQALKNSFIVASAVMAVNVVFGSLAAYTFSRFSFRYKPFFLNFVLGSRLIPAIAVAIPYYIIIQSMGLLDTHLALILVYLALTLPFTIWFLTLFFNGIPRDFEDAALIDGCSYIQALVKVVLPMSIPGLVTAAAFAFMTMRLPSEVNRQDFMIGCRDAGIQTSIHYRPIHTFTNYQAEYGKTWLPITDYAASREVTLPLFPTMTPDQQAYVIENVIRLVTGK